MKRIVVVLAAIAMAYVGVSSADAGEVLDRIMADGKIVNALDPEYPPFSFIGSNNELEGFDVDVANEFARRLGVDIEYVTPGWDIITAGKWSGRWDICLGSMTATAERAEVLTFPADYYYTQARIIVNKDNTTVTGPADLTGKRIGVQVSTTYENYLNRNLEIDAVDAVPIVYQIDDPHIVSYDEQTLAADDLSLGDGVRLDAMVADVLTATEYIDNGAPLKIVGEPLFYEPIAVAIDKGDPEFAAKVAEIIGEMYADGTLKQLSEARFGVDITAPPSN
jgi:polar amino acid transport system substrate-binding protein